jgi:putative FmdB family regulatory protein
MPTYGYRCEKNGHEFEVVQGINDPPLTRCRVCGSKVRRIFYPVGIVFKGPGFYKTDSRESSSIASADGDKSGSEGGAEKAAAKDKSGDKAATVKKADGKKSKGEATSKKGA